MSDPTLPHVRALILDIDGVIWKGNQPIGDLQVIFKRIRNRGYRLVLATNNSTRTVEQYLDEFINFGVDLDPWQIISSGEVAAHYLSQLYPNGGNVFVVGENGLMHTLEHYGFHNSIQSVLAVVSGLDRYFSYEKLSQAALLIRSGVQFIGTNPDKSLPTPQGLVPGAGSILACLEAATDIKPRIMGKPSPDIYRFALERLGTSPSETIAIGDRIDTDIVGAQAMGLQTALVLSGVTTVSEAEAWPSKINYIAQDLSTLLEVI
jgi:4-nitrophenyl phosphatase